jgi:hypothetical protein
MLFQLNVLFYVHYLQMTLLHLMLFQNFLSGLPGHGGTA